MSNDDPEYLLKMVQQVRRGDRNEINGVRDMTRDYIGSGDDHAMSFKMKDVVDFAPEATLLAPPDRIPAGP